RAEDPHLRGSFRRQHQPDLRHPSVPPDGPDAVDRLLLRPNPSGERGVPRKVEALLDREHRGQIDLEHLTVGPGLPLGARSAVDDLQALHAGDAWQIERMRDAEADLIVTAV